MPPYCDHPECHGLAFSYTKGLGNSSSSGFPTQEIWHIHLEWVPGERHWCKAHALLNEGWCLG